MYNFHLCETPVFSLVFFFCIVLFCFVLFFFQFWFSIFRGFRHATINTKASNNLEVGSVV